MVTFPTNSDHIYGVKYGQRGTFADGTLRTEMERGAAKVRVRDGFPAKLTTVTLICTDIGLAQLWAFYLDDARQTAKFFYWPCLPKYDDDVLMRFAAEPQEQEREVGGVGLWDVSISLEIRRVPVAPSATLIAEVEALFGSVAAFYAVNGLLPVELLQPQLEMWGGIDVPNGLIAQPDPAAAYYDFYLDVIGGDFNELLAQLIVARNDAAALGLEIAAA